MNRPNPFSHDNLSNAQTDFSFSEDQGVPNQHLVSFAQAMDAPRTSLSEDDYRFPAVCSDTDRPIADDSRSVPQRTWMTPTDYRDGYFPKGYAP